MEKTVKILLASTQVRGVIGDGGLGDVAAAVAKAVNNCDCEFKTDLIMPVFHRDAQEKAVVLQEQGKITSSAVIHVPYDGNDYPVEVLESSLLVKNTTTFLLKCNALELEKNKAEEAVFFARCVCEFCKGKEYQIIHCNDWNTGLIPVYLKKIYTGFNIKTLYTAHNAEGGFQGEFDGPKRIIEIAGLQPYEWELLDPKTDSKFSVIHNWKFNFLKTAICSADRVNTVSETYHNELLQTNFGGGLVGVFEELKKKGTFSGILNGIDMEEFNPQKNTVLKENKLNFGDVPGAVKTRTELRKKDFWKKYWLDQMIDTETGKTDIFKVIRYLEPHWLDAVQQSSRINEDIRIPIIGTVTRIDYQKVPILVETLKRIIKPDCGFQFILMGTDNGDDTGKSYTDEFKNLNQKYPYNFLFFNIFDTDFSHLLYALIDIFVVPSIWEPCGLTQMYALKYGAPAIVRKTGGLLESIKDGITGFHFLEDPANSNKDGRADVSGAAQELAAAIEKALDIKKNDKKRWKDMMEAGMKENFSWEKTIPTYVQRYREVLAKATP